MNPIHWLDPENSKLFAETKDKFTDGKTDAGFAVVTTPQYFNLFFSLRCVHKKNIMCLNRFYEN